MSSFCGVTCAQTGCIMEIQCLYDGTKTSIMNLCYRTLVPFRWFTHVYWPCHGSCWSSPCTHQSLIFRRVRQQLTEHFTYTVCKSPLNFVPFSSADGSGAVSGHFGPSHKPFIFQRMGTIGRIACCACSASCADCFKESSWISVELKFFSQFQHT